VIKVFNAAKIVINMEMGFFMEKNLLFLMVLFLFSIFAVGLASVSPYILKEALCLSCKSRT